MSTTICRTRRPGGPPRAIRAAGNPLVSLFATRRRQSQVAPPGARRDFGFDVGGFRRAGLATRSAIEVSWSGEGRFRTVSQFVFFGKKEATKILSSIKQVADPLWPAGPYAPRFQCMASRSARSAARPCTRSCSFEASEAIPFPGRGFNLFKPLRRHFRATPFCRHVLSRRDPGDRNASAQKIDDQPRRSPPGRRRRNKHRTTTQLWQEIC